MLQHCRVCGRIPIGSTRLCQERALGMGEDYGHSHGHFTNVYLHIIFFNLIGQVIFYFLTPPPQFEISEHASDLCIFLFAFTRLQDTTLLEMTIILTYMNIIVTRFNGNSRAGAAG